MRNLQRVVLASMALGILAAATVLAQPPAAVPEDAPAEPLPAKPAEEPAKPQTADEKPDSEAGPQEPVPPPRKREPVDPELLTLHLMDGSRISGKFTINDITVTTEFGTLTIPITRINSFTPGLDSHPELDKRIQGYIDDLGGTDFKRRERAEQELAAMGPPVRNLLEAHLEDKNAERRRRVKTILTKINEGIDEFAAPNNDENRPWIREDAVETPDFTVVGRISPDVFTLNNRFGTLTIRLAHIERMVRERGPEDVRRSFSVDAGRHMVQRGFFNSGIEVRAGDRVIVQASGLISRSGSSSYNSSPRGNSRLGTYGSGVTGGTLIARVGKGGKVISVGDRKTFAAPSDGPLYFAIAMSDNYARYTFVGAYNVKVHVDRTD